MFKKLLTSEIVNAEENFGFEVLFYIILILWNAFIIKFLFTYLRIAFPEGNLGHISI